MKTQESVHQSLHKLQNRFVRCAMPLQVLWLAAIAVGFPVAALGQTASNSAPVLAAIGAKTVDELSALTFAAIAADEDEPANALTFSLSGAPEGAVIDGTTGAFAWTPTEDQGPGVYTFDVVVTDDGTPPLSASETIEVTVSELNAAPLLAAIGHKTVDESTELTFTASATDADAPANTLTFSLSGAPDGTAIDGSTGAFAWTPTEAQGPGVYTFDVVVTDDGTPPLSASETIEVTVLQPPSIPVIVNILPTVAPSSALVTIQGRNFSPNIAENIVFFGGVQASIQDATANQLTVTVPSGAVLAPISVTVGGLTAYSPRPFTPTFLGNGLLAPGSFAPRFNFPSVGKTLVRIVAGDLNGDNKPELVAVSDAYPGGDAFATVYQNEASSESFGASSFSRSVKLPAGLRAWSAHLADLDGDGKLDLLIAAIGSSGGVSPGKIYIYQNKSNDPQLSPDSFGARIDLEAGLNTCHVEALDLNLDGRPDIVACNPASDDLIVFQNVYSTGDLSANSFAPAARLAVASPHWLALADVDGDTLPDITAVNSANGRLSVFRNLSVGGDISTSNFAARVDFDVDIGSAYLALGDLDGDGLLDAATSSYQSGTVNVLRNTSQPGMISFSPRLSLVKGQGAHQVTLADVNGDGKLDLIVAGEYANVLSFWQNVGTVGVLDAASFAPKLDYAVGSNPTCGFVGDLSGDGLPEIAVANYYNYNVSIFFNQTATNLPPVFLAQPSDRSVNLGDTVTFAVTVSGTSPIDFQWFLNGEAISDATNANLTITNVQLEALGSYHVVAHNSFGSATSQPAALTLPEPPTIELQPANVAVPVGNNAQFTVVAAGTEPLAYRWFLNGVALSNSSHTTGTKTPSLAINGVQIADAGDYTVVVENVVGSITSAVATLTVLSPPTIVSQPSDKLTVAGSSVSFSVVAAGTMPLAYQWRFNEVNLTDGPTISGANSAVLNLIEVQVDQAGPYSVIISNVDGVITSRLAGLQVLESSLDEAVPIIHAFDPQVGVAGSEVTITGENFATMPDHNTVFFGSVQATTISADSNSLTVVLPTGSIFAPISVTVGGLTAYSPTPFVPSFWGDGPIAQSSFSSPVNLPGVGKTLVRVVAGDLDGDGKPDLVAVSDAYGSGDAFISVYRNAGATSPLVSESFPLSAQLPAGLRAWWATLADLNGDGKLEIIVASIGSSSGAAPGKIFVYQNNCTRGSIGANSFGPAIVLSSGINASCVAAVDLNRDGKPDLVSGNPGSNDLFVFQNAATNQVLTTNSFVHVATLAVNNPGNLAVGDLDGDEAPDLVAVNAAGGKLSVFRNLNLPGGITASNFEARVDFPIDTGSYYVALGDLDGDGRLDAVSTSYSSGMVNVLKNTTVPGVIDANSFAPKFNLSKGHGAHQVSLGDLNGDGKLDLAVAGEGGNAISVWQNISTNGTLSVASFSARVDYATGSNPTCASIVDVSGDGLPDLVVANYYSQNLSLYQNRSPSMNLPLIIAQPGDLTVVAGSNATFVVQATGTMPLSYQWYVNASPIPDATNSLLSLDQVPMSAAGVYHVTVSNVLGMITSGPAVLQVVLPPTTITLLPALANSSEEFSTRLEIDARGNENALSFSLRFDPLRLTFVGAIPASEINGAQLLVNASQAHNGYIGLAVALPSGQSFPAIKQEILQVTFVALISHSDVNTTIEFGDQPTIRQLADSSANVLPVAFVPGLVLINAVDLEADVTPRPSGDRAVSVTDWVQVGRFVAALDTNLSPSEFQRADCAPLSERGDGRLSVIDWVQAGRYAVGLDPLNPVSGPTNETVSGDLVKASQTRRQMDKANGTQSTVSIQGAKHLLSGRLNSLYVSLTAQGGEHALGFSLGFDPAVLTFRAAALGNNTGGASLNVNALQAGNGRIGILLELPFGSQFQPGTQQLVRLDFDAHAEASASAELRFTDSPILCEISDTKASSILAAWQSASLIVLPPNLLPPVSIVKSSPTQLTIAWPNVIPNAVLEFSDSLQPGSWMPVTDPITPAGDMNTVNVPATGSLKFYRVREE